jgi:D-3-phosphoglycerate dehydrogenase / 2-oxoglutarate reductase
VRVLVAEPLSDEGLELLRTEHEVEYRPDLTRTDFLALLPDFDALVVRSGVKVDAEAIAAGARLRIVGRAGVGVDNIDVPAATAAEILVVNAPTANTIAAAELTVGLIYALARHIPQAEASLRRGEWRRADFVGMELRGKTLGIIGLGKIGLAVAERARAMEMSLLGSDPLVSADAAAARAIELVEVDELLRRADVVTLHVPLNAATRGLIGNDALLLMKPTAYLINVARGGVVDEAALALALGEGRLAGAAVDVYEHEPPTDSPLLAAPHLVLTPHLGASTREAQQKAGVEVAEQVLDALAGREARYAVNSVSTAASRT